MTPLQIEFIQPMPPGTATEVVPAAQTQLKEDMAGYYQIILFDDDEHSYGYVIDMMQSIFGMSEQDAYNVAYTVDYCGQAVVKTCPLEEAVIGRDAILNYGPDYTMERSTGSMKAIIQEVGE